VQEHRIVEVKWDTSDENWNPLPGEVDLPELVTVPVNVKEEDISDWLSDRWGYCHFGWRWWSADKESRTMAANAYSSDPM
tara:strand:+ start:2825 stop:3064 length:240 start_codon:yes stop_codon:yes gene_type:complete